MLDWFVRSFMEPNHTTTDRISLLSISFFFFCAVKLLKLLLYSKNTKETGITRWGKKKTNFQIKIRANRFLNIQICFFPFSVLTGWFLVIILWRFESTSVIILFALLFYSLRRVIVWSSSGPQSLHAHKLNMHPTGSWNKSE